MKAILFLGAFFLVLPIVQAQNCASINYESLKNRDVSSDIKATLKAEQKTFPGLFKRKYNEKVEGYKFGSFVSFPSEACHIEHHHHDAEKEIDKETDASNPFGKNRGKPLKPTTEWTWHTPIQTNKSTYIATRFKLQDSKNPKRVEEEIRLICEKKDEDKSFQDLEARFNSFMSSQLCLTENTQKTEAPAAVQNGVAAGEKSKASTDRKPANSK